MNRPDISKLRKNRSIFMNIGFIISLSMVILAFNYTTYDPMAGEKYTTEPMEVEPDIPITRAIPKKPKVVPPPSIELTKKLEADLQEFIEEPEPEPTIVESKVEVKTVPKKAPFVAPTPEPTPPPPAPIEVEPEVETVFQVVEEMPRFPGCEEVGTDRATKVQCATNKLLRYLSNQIKYPRFALENHIQGTVYISFIVNEKGAITDIKVLKEPGAGLGKEAVRVVKTMPNWTPGKQRGKPVKVQFNLPVKFRLN